MVKDGLPSLKWRESRKVYFCISYALSKTTSKTSRYTNSGGISHTGTYTKNSNTSKHCCNNSYKIFRKKTTVNCCSFYKHSKVHCNFEVSSTTKKKRQWCDFSVFSSVFNRIRALGNRFNLGGGFLL